MVKTVCAAVALLAACGGPTPATPAPDAAAAADADAIAVDAGPDAPPDAPWTVGVITVTARNGLMTPYAPGIFVSAGTSVVFTDATQQTQVVVTDASGVASATVTGPTTVTHVQSYSSIADEAMTIVGAMPGDDILLERVNRDHTTLTPMTVSFTPAANTSYWACTACACASGSTSPLMAPMIALCATNPAKVVLLASSGAATSYASGSAAYDPGSGGSITLAPSTAAHTYTGTFTNLPAEVSRLVFDFRSGMNSRVDLSGPASSEALQVSGWSGLPARFDVVLQRGDGAHQWINEDIDPTTTGISLDASSTLLPWLGPPFFTAATQTFHAPSLPGATPGDLFIGTFAHSRMYNSKSVIWTIFADAPSAFVMPYIPTSVADMTPKPNTHGFVGSYMFAAASVDGYAEARLNPLKMWRDSRYGGNGERMYRSESYNAGAAYEP